MNANNIGQAFDTLMGTMFTRHEGVKIEILEEGYRVFGKTYPTLYLAKKRVELSFIRFKNTIWQQSTITNR